MINEKLNKDFYFKLVDLKGRGGGGILNGRKVW